MPEDFTINLVLSTNQSHLDFAATTVASVSRRTKYRVHARIYVRDADLPESFQSGNLTVEFLRPGHNPSARLPGHVHPCTFDRLEIVDYATDWDRCWLLDTDQVALRDLADLYRTDFEDQWMIAIVGETNREICRKWFHHDWPVDAPAGDQLAPYFGALLNLKAMREGNFTETFRWASERWGMNEQLCASIAVNGRIKPAPETSNWLVWGYKDCNSSVRADLEWGAFTPHVIHWPMGSKPWNDYRLWAAQLWIRELTDWSELRHECAFRIRDREKVPAIVLHLAGMGVNCGSLLDDLEDSGFGVELLRGCDPQIRFAVRDSVSLVLNFFGWKPCRHAMARVISHRWAWQHFLEQSDQPYSVICDDGMALRSTESEVRDLCGSMGSGAWYIDLLGGSSSCGGTTNGQEPQDLEFRSISYCINRDAARILLDLDLTTDRALFGSRDSLQDLNVGRSERPYFEEFVRVAAREQGDETLVGNCPGEPDSTYDRNTRILIGICSCDTHLEKRNAVRASWFPKETSRMKARLFVGNGSTIVGENDTVIVNAKDDYLHLPQKVMEFFRHALANFEFDWLFKCDDDTFVAVDRLAELACANHDYVGNEFLVDRGYASGGAGYLLKRSLLEKIVAESSYPETGDEDVIFGQLSMSNHAVTHATSKLCFDSSRIPRWDNDIVTCHWVSPEKMMALHVIHGSAPEFLVEAEHPLWQDHVLLFEKGYFARKSVADVGRWKWNEVNRELILEWFDYPSEIFSVSEGSKAKLVSGELENSQPEFRILIAICSERNRIESREAVRQTWLSNLPEGMQYTFFAGGGSPLSDEPDTVICDVEERPDLLTRKVLAFYEQVMKHHEFDWLFRCDDDTYVSLQRLASLVEPEFDLIGNEFIDLRGSPSAGAGYLISRKGIATVLDAASRDPSEGEEALVGRAVSMSGGRMKSSDRLQWDHSRQPRKYNSVITCHWCAPDRLRWIDAMFQGKPDREFLAVHRHWTDRLLFHSNGFFERGDNRDHGSWEEDPEGNLELKWKDWPAETVLRSESGYASGDMTLVEACRRNRRKSIGEDPILLDLRGIPIYGVSGRAYEARRLRLDKTLSKLGWYEPHYFTSELHRERGRAWSSITFNHLAAITSQEPPFIVLEDDAMPTQWLMDEIEIPFGCDAVWLGMTTYGMRNGESAADGAEFEGDPALPRISNMLGTHAILYLSKEFVAAVREALFALIQLNPITPHDRVLASMQAGWCIHGVNPPLFYQDDGHAPCVTNAPISLPGC